MRSSTARSSAKQAVPHESERAPFLVPHTRSGTSEERERSFPKAILAGLVGGLIGTVVMTEFQNAWSRASATLNRGKEPTGKQGQEQETEDAIMKAAAKLAGLVGKQLSYEQEKKLGPVVDYTFGTLQGGVYGAATELFGVRGGFVPGLSFGAALFALVDELSVPALGLSGWPSEYPLSAHLYGLASHLVYGVSTEIARRGLRAAL